MGHWFDVCKCNALCTMPMPMHFCTGSEETVMEYFAYHIKKRIYNKIELDGLSVLARVLQGNIWEGESKAIKAIFFDEKADEEQSKLFI